MAGIYSAGASAFTPALSSGGYFSAANIGNTGQFLGGFGQAIGGLGSLYGGYKNYKLGKDTLNFQKDVYAYNRDQEEKRLGALGNFGSGMYGA